MNARVSAGRYGCMQVCMYVCIHTHVHVQRCMHSRTGERMCASMYDCAHACECSGELTCSYESIYIQGMLLGKLADTSQYRCWCVCVFVRANYNYYHLCVFVCVCVCVCVCVLVS